MHIMFACNIISTTNLDGINPEDEVENKNDGLYFVFAIILVVGIVAALVAVRRWKKFCNSRTAGDQNKAGGKFHESKFLVDAWCSETYHFCLQSHNYHLECNNAINRWLYFNLILSSPLVINVLLCCIYRAPGPPKERRSSRTKR